jgi:hypothetical protein
MEPWPWFPLIRELPAARRIGTPFAFSLYQMEPKPDGGDKPRRSLENG